MELVSQSEPRVRRPWTPQEQITAEVAAACGVSLAEIGKLFRRDQAVIRCHLSSAAAAARFSACQRYLTANRHKHRETCRRYRENFPDVVKASQQRFYEANPDAKRTYYIKHHAERIAAMRKYYYRNQERIRQWRIANIETRRRQFSSWRQKNIEHIRQYQLDNRDWINQQRRQWYAANRTKAIEKARRYNSRKRASRRTALVVIGLPDLTMRLNAFSNSCAYCGQSSKLEADHVLALSKGGIDETSNIVPACRRCNASKHARPVETWYRRQPFFTEARWRKIQRHCPSAVVGQLPLAFLT